MNGIFLLNANLGLIADGILILIMLILISIGYKKGFIKSVLSFFGTIAALIVAFFLCRQFSVLLQDKFGLLDKFIDIVGNWLKGNPKFAIEISAENLEASLKAAGIPGFMISVIMSLSVVKENTYPSGTTVADLVSPVLANYILIAVSFLGLFLLFKILMVVLKALADSLKAIKLIDNIDKILGIVIGFLQGAIIVYLLLTVIAFFPSVLEKPSRAVQESTIAKYLNDSDILGKALTYVVDKNKLNNKIEEFIKGKEQGSIQELMFHVKH